jgi:calmodulin
MTEKIKDKDREDSNKDLKKAFQIFDRDGDKKIDKNEFYFVIRNLDTDLSDKEINEMMTQADLD